MKLKIGRNDPCVCGSGKKYKKCCYLKSEDGVGIPQKVINHFEAIKRKKQQLEAIGTRIDFVRPIPFQGKKVWAVGNQIFSGGHESQTSHEFIIDYLKIKIGDEWLRQQDSLVPQERHFIHKCFDEYYKWRRAIHATSQPNKEGVFSTEPNGWTQSLISLAYDVVCLKHTNYFQSQLLDRLKIKSDYQSVRYEIMVGAVVARLGFKIQWETPATRGVKRPEFIAFNETGLKFWCEAKSRHRGGILHNTQGQFDIEKHAKGDIFHLVHQAEEKVTDGIPYLIFIDLNCPPTPDLNIDQKRWFRDINKKIQEENKNKTTSIYNAAFITNFGSHYDMANLASPGEVLTIVARNPEALFNNTASNTNLISDVQRALYNYYYIPEIETKV